MTLDLGEPLSTLARLRGRTGLLPLYASVHCEARRSLDDWITIANLEAFESFVHRLGLAVVRDCIFEPLECRRIDGLDRSPTTHSRGRPLRDLASVSPQAQVHVFVSAREEWAEEALASFSYPVAIPEDRLLIRPRIDATRVGAAFGFPPCCIRSFLRWNDWHRRSHFSHVFRASVPHDWAANCLPRDSPLMTIFHTPCHPACTATLEMSRRTWETVQEWDPEYANRIAAHLRGVFLVFNEAVVFKLHDADEEGEDQYRFSRAEPIMPTREIAPPQVAAARALLDSATSVQITDGMVLTDGPGATVYEVDPGSRWVDDPCIVRFA